MHWEDTEDQPQMAVSQTVADVRYQIRCRELPVDHAAPLYAELCAQLPWLETEPAAGIHAIHGAESGNGWIRPDDPAALLPLSRRTRLVLRLPRVRIAEAAALTDCTLDIAGHAMHIGTPRVAMLSGTATVFARYIALDADSNDEEAFLAAATAELADVGIAAPRLMPGRAHDVAADGEVHHCRSLMIDGLTQADSVQLQEQGLGHYRLYGCGLFLPHKSIAAVGAAAE